MILTLPQIKDILNGQPDPLIQKGVEYNKKLRFHVFGENKEGNIATIEGYEKEPDFNLRKKHTTTNKDVFARLGRPIDKVFSARGGSVYYNLSGDAEKKARNLSGDIRDGFSVKSWLSSFWTPQMLADPYGIIFMEIITKDMQGKYKQTGQSFTYPTYKPISSIHKYLPKGSSFEYIIFKVDDSEKKSYGLDDKHIYFRVVDDAMDYIIKKEGEDVFIMADLSLPNYFMYVPAMRNSDIQDPKCEGGVLSLYDDAIELAEKYLLKNSIKAIHDFKHGFPHYAEIASDCPECTGGYVGADKCPRCKGSGKSPLLRPQEVRLVGAPNSKDDALILPKDIFAYNDVPKTFYDISVADLADLENKMTITTWGTQAKQRTNGLSTSQGGDTKTATEIVDEFKPQADRLEPLSEMTEKRHKFILDAAIKININQSYTGSSVNYGRRYMIESPEAIWEKYSDARTKGSPQNVLDELLNEFYDAKYQSDAMGLAVAKKLMYVEPFVHLTIQNVKDLGPSEEDFKAKLYFSEWLATINDIVLITMDVAALKDELSNYSSKKQLQVADKKLLPAA